jgi:hypothetical protein
VYRSALGDSNPARSIHSIPPFQFNSELVSWQVLRCGHRHTGICYLHAHQTSDAPLNFMLAIIAWQ